MSENDQRLSALLEQSELEVMRGLADMSLPDLHRLEQLEMDGQNRDRILDAIDSTFSAKGASE